MNGIIAGVLSAAIACSAFLPWIDIRVILEVSLWDIVSGNLGSIWDGLTGGAPWGAWTFALSFPVALVSVLINLKQFSRLVSLIAGALPLVSLGWVVVTGRDRAIEFFGQVPGEAGQLREIMGLGIPLYALAALLLVLFALTARVRWR
jgi:hypothetical protein